MKIGIYTFTAANNYGAVLQAYALKQYLCKNGYDAHCIDYRPKFLKNRFSPFHGFDFRIWKGSCIRRNIKEVIRLPFVINKNRLFDKFRHSNLSLIPVSSEDVDLYIIGSDQVWNYSITNGDRVFMGNIPNACGNVISYAASMELSLSKENVDDFKRQLENFKAISVRENELKTLIESTFHKKCCQVVDPTLLLSPSEWRQISKPYKKQSNRYVFMYGFGFNNSEIKRARNFAIKHGLDFVLASSGVKISDGYSNNISPEQFLFLVDHAEYVITNSFHGTVFSIIFEKRFLEIPHNGLKKNTRVVNLLRNLKANIEPFDINKGNLEGSFLKLDYHSEPLHLIIEESKEYLKSNLFII